MFSQVNPVIEDPSIDLDELNERLPGLVRQFQATRDDFLNKINSLIPLVDLAGLEVKDVRAQLLAATYAHAWELNPFMAIGYGLIAESPPGADIDPGDLMEKGSLSSLDVSIRGFPLGGLMFSEMGVFTYQKISEVFKQVLTEELALVQKEHPDAKVMTLFFKEMRGFDFVPGWNKAVLVNFLKSLIADSDAQEIENGTAPESHAAEGSVQRL